MRSAYLLLMRRPAWHLRSSYTYYLIRMRWERTRDKVNFNRKLHDNMTAAVSWYMPSVGHSCGDANSYTVYVPMLTFPGERSLQGQRIIH